MRFQRKKIGQISIGISAPVLARAAGSSPRLERPVLADGSRAVLHRMAMSHGKERRTMHQLVVDTVIDLIHVGAVIGRLASGAAFEHKDFETGSSDEFFGRQQAGPAAADDYD